MFNKKKGGNQSALDLIDGTLLDAEEEKVNKKKEKIQKTGGTVSTFMNTLFVNDASFFVENLMSYYSKICSIMSQGNFIDSANDKTRASRKIQE